MGRQTEDEAVPDSAQPRTGARHVVYENAHQQVYRVRVDFAKFSKEIFVTDYGERVGVVVHGVKGVALVRQYRHLIHRVSWEIPGGRVEAGETLEQAALRECAEETGVVCRSLEPLLTFQPGLDTLHNPTRLFYTRSFDEMQGEVRATGIEVCRREWVALRKCISMIASGEIVDSLSVIALLAYITFVKEHEA